MRIGIASNSDISCFKSFFKTKEEHDILETNCIKNFAPAVNTLILSFLKQGHFIRLFTLANEDFFIKSKNIEIIGISAYNKYPFKYLWGEIVNSNNIKKQIESNFKDLDVLHAHWTYAYAYACRDVAKVKPVFCSVRDIAQYIYSVLTLKHKIIWLSKLYINRKVFKNKNFQFIANSEYTKAMIMKYYKLDVPVIENPIKESFISYNKRKDFDKNKVKIISISSDLDKRKNIITLLYAFNLLLKEKPNTELIIIGPPFVYTNPIVQEWNTLQLLNNVKLVGAVNHDELKVYLDDSDIYISSSLEETYGNTIIEAMARKIPIIAGENSGAIPFILKKGSYGELCNVSDPSSICQTLIKIIDNYDLAIEKANDGYSFLIKNNLDKVITDKHLIFYKNE